MFIPLEKLIILGILTVAFLIVAIGFYVKYSKVKKSEMEEVDKTNLLQAIISKYTTALIEVVEAALAATKTNINSFDSVEEYRGYINQIATTELQKLLLASDVPLVIKDAITADIISTLILSIMDYFEKKSVNDIDTFTEEPIQLKNQVDMFGI